jgi:ADP-ribose pyrophosphatase YjhB (NUDIX family)
MILIFEGILKFLARIFPYFRYCMQVPNQLSAFIHEGEKWFLPAVSLDCVILGFHDNQLKVLLLKLKHSGVWALPGGFVLKEEDTESAAARVLKERTGLQDIFLQQFHVFGAPNRSDGSIHRKGLLKSGIEPSPDNWLFQRFISIGYYALVDFAHVTPFPDENSTECVWKDIHEIGSLMMDHNEILNKALETVRLQLNHQPIGYNLLPQKFTMPELQTLYETILDKQLDRRNFHRKMTAFGILKRLKETRKGGAHRAPFLYSFDMRKYQKALKQGLNGGW